MALITKRIYRISDSHSALNAAQIGVEATPDGDLGFKMYGGKDDAGSITKWLAKDKPGMLSTLNLSGASTTGSVGLIQHDTLGNLTGGQLTVAEFNTFISDGGVQWTRDAGNTRLLPLVNTDKINVGMGTEATPGVAFGAATSSGMYYGVVTSSYNGLGFSVGGDQVVGLAKDSGASIIQGAANLDFNILHQRTDASGSADMLIENSCNQATIPATLDIKCTAVTASATIGLESQNLDVAMYNDIDIVADLGTITLQAKGLTVGGVVIESDWMEFQNYTAYSPIPMWNAGTQWAAYESAFGVSYPILQALVDLSTGGGGGTLDDAYDFGGAGAGKGITVDAGAVSLTVPSSGSNGALALTNQESTNALPVINLYNDAAASTGYAIYLDGDAGGDQGVDEWGHRIWTEGSLTMGHGYGSGASRVRSYTRYDYDDESVVDWAQGILAAEGQDPVVAYARVWVRGGLYGGVLSGRVLVEASNRIELDSANYINIDSGTGDINITSGVSLDLVSTTGDINLGAGDDIWFNDSNRSGSTWATSTGIRLSASSTEWDDMETLGSGEVSVFALISAAAASGISEPANQIVYGTGTGVTSSSALKWSPSLVELQVSGDISMVGGASVKINMNEAELREIRAVNAYRYSITVTTNTFTVDPDNGSLQKVSFSANTTWGLIRPDNHYTCVRLEIWNTDTSDHTLTIADVLMDIPSGENAYIHWADPLEDGFTIVAGEMTVCVIWYLGMVGADPHWMVSATGTTAEMFGE